MSWDTQTHKVLSGLEVLCSSLQAVSKMCNEESPSPAALHFSKQLSGTMSEVKSAIEGIFSMCGLLENEDDKDTRLFASRAVYTVLLQQCAHFFGEVAKNSSSAGVKFKLEAAESTTTKKTAPVKPPAPVVAPTVIPTHTQQNEPESSDESEDEVVEVIPKKPPVAEIKHDKKVKIPSHTSRTASAQAHILIVGDGSIERALGPLVLTARPQNLSPLDGLLLDHSGALVRPKLHYLLADGVSLETVAVACFNSENPDEEIAQAQNDATLDLLCDSIKSDDIEVTPFSGSNGEVSFASETLPSVAWRVASTVDEASTLQTFLCFCEVRGIGKCLLIQDKLSFGDETLHVLREKSNSVVEVMCISPTRGHDTLGALYKRFFGEFFAVEEIKEDQDAAMVAMSVATKLREKHVQDRKSQSSSQKGDTPDEVASTGGILGVGKTIVKMPLNIGKGVVESLSAASQDVVFRKNFPELVDEELLNYFNCAWKQDDSSILKQGYVYATKHHLCFQSSVLAASFKLQYDEISTLSKKKSIGVLNNSILIETVDDEKFFLTSFISRDDAYKALYAAWTKSER